METCYVVGSVTYLKLILTRLHKLESAAELIYQQYGNFIRQAVLNIKIRDGFINIFLINTALLVTESPASHKMILN